PRGSAPPLGASPGRGPWRRRPWATCEERVAWPPWTSRALDPEALVSPYLLMNRPGTGYGEPISRSKGPLIRAYPKSSLERHYRRPRLSGVLANLTEFIHTPTALGSYEAARGAVSAVFGGCCPCAGTQPPIP